jgi:hypothetical protein
MADTSTEVPSVKGGVCGSSTHHGPEREFVAVLVLWVVCGADADAGQWSESFVQWKWKSFLRITHLLFAPALLQCHLQGVSLLPEKDLSQLVAAAGADYAP